MRSHRKQRQSLSSSGEYGGGTIENVKEFSVYSTNVGEYSISGNPFTEENNYQICCLCRLAAVVLQIFAFDDRNKGFAKIIGEALTAPNMHMWPNLATENT